MKSLRIGVAAIGRISEETGGRNYIEHFFRTAEKLRENGEHQHELILFLSAGEAQKMNLPKAVRVVELPKLGGTSAAKVFSEQVLVPLAIKREGVEVMYYPGNFAALVSSVPYVLSVRAVAHFYGKEYNVSPVRRFVRSQIMPPSVKAAKAVITPSEDIKRDLVRFTNADSSKITVIPHGIDSDLFNGEVNRGLTAGHKVLERFGLTAGRYLIYVSALWKYKNQDKLIEAFASVKSRIPGTKLVLAGKGTGVDDDYVADLHALVEHHQLGQDAIFTGNLLQSELRFLYAHASAMIFPSSYESFGNPILESWASGIPIAVSNTHSFPEIVGQAGLFFDPTSRAELENAILILLQDGSIRQRLVELGAERLKNFSWDSTLKRTLSLLESVSSS